MSFIKAFNEFSAALCRQYMRPPSKMVVDERTYREIHIQISNNAQYPRDDGFQTGITINTMLGETLIINQHQERGEFAANALSTENEKD